MAKLIQIEGVKTYKTEANAIKAVEQFGYPDSLRYFIHRTPTGRFFAVFIGHDAIQAGVHFNFNVIG